MRQAGERKDAAVAARRAAATGRSEPLAVRPLRVIPGKENQEEDEE